MNNSLHKTASDCNGKLEVSIGNFEVHTNKSNLEFNFDAANSTPNTSERSTVVQRRFPERVAFEKGYRVLFSGTLISPFNGPLNPRANERGYFYFKVNCGGIETNCKVHRLQAFQKFGEQIYTAGLEVRHKNGNPKDNSADNILIGTAEENAADKSPEVRRRAAAAATAAMKKHDHAAIRAFYQECKSYRRTMAAFGLTSKGVLHYALNGRN